MVHFLPNYPPQLWPPAASATAGEVDEIAAVWAAVLALLVGPVFIFMAYCAIRFRAGRNVDRSHRVAHNTPLEMTWTIIPFLISLVFFFWAGSVYLRERNPPPNAMQITAVGRRWMWKFQQPTGQWEINNLHVPVGRPVRINIKSQDVVHSLYIPAMREQEEAIPGRTTELWFKADRIGAYRLFCSELCGADHALMSGTLYVMSPANYQHWLKTYATTGPTLITRGKQLFDSYGCAGCHLQSGTVRAPSLFGVYGGTVPLSNGTTVTADEAYLRDSILEPKKQVVAGFKPIMPGFAGKIPDADLEQILAYLRAIGAGSENVR